MKRKEKGNFEFIKEENDQKFNYIFKKDKLTKTTFYVVAAILLVLIAVTIYYGSKVN